jgi:predicted PurR-regulated permease PerM
VITQAQHARFWLIALLVFLGLFWLFSPMLLPFAVAIVVAYFLNPLVNMLQQKGARRPLGSIIVLVSFLLAVFLIMLLVVPLIQTQVSALIIAVPDYIQAFRRDVQPYFDKFLSRLSPEDLGNIQNVASGYAGNVVGWFARILENIVTGSMALFDILTLLIVTPVVAFYLLRDWPKLTTVIDQMIPRSSYDRVKQELTCIDQTLAGFIRGQGLVCLCLATLYGTGLTLSGLNYGATIGIVAGLLSFIPYVGTLFGVVTSLLLGFTEFDAWQPIAIIAAVFVVGQILEGYFLTPKLVGDRVGLHPVWILFSLFAGASLFGFVGILVAVPVAAVLGVLLRLAARLYRGSSYYQ